MIMTLILPPPKARPLQRLIVRESSQHAEDDRDPCIELHAHERVRHAVADVLEVHRRALDEHPDRDDRVEGLVRHVRRRRYRRPGARPARNWGRHGQAAEAAEEIRRRRAGLYVGSRDDSVRTTRAWFPRRLITEEEDATGRSAYLWHARGSSKLPGTVWTTMLWSLTPCAFSFLTAPATSASMTVLFHRAWTMATLRGAPSKEDWDCGRLLIELIVVGA